MAWRDLLEPASFRGVEFKVESDDMTGGRRTATHQYPKRDKPYVEDMGRSARTISFSAYVLGADYVQSKDALLDALETEGPGELIHPFYGVRTVQAGAYTVRITRDEGGIARFALEFTETGDSLYPSAVNNPSDAVDTAADSAGAASQSVFEDGFSVAGLPQFAVDKAQDVLDSATAIMGSVLGPIKASADEVARITQEIDLIQAEAESLIRSPSEMATRLRGVFSLVSESSASQDSKSSVLKKFYEQFATTPEPTPTDTRADIESNRDALDSFIHEVALIEAVRAAAGQEFASLDEAEDARDKLADYIDEQADTAPDAVFEAMTALRAKLVLAIPGEDGALPSIVTKFLPETTPAIVLAYRYYADADRGDEIAERNHIPHPSFIKGGVPIKVLTDA